MAQSREQLLAKKRAHMKGYYLRNKTKIRAYVNSWKIANREKKRKTDKIYNEKNKVKNKQYKAEHYLKNKVYYATKNKKWRYENKDKIAAYLLKNKEKINQVHKAWREKNRDKVNANRRMWAKNNPQSALETSRNWAKKNPEKSREIKSRWAENNREKIRQSSLRWRKDNPEKVAIHGANQKARRHRATHGSTITKDEWSKIKSIYNNLCAYCRKEAKLTMDHAKPLIRGGLHAVSNIVPACKSCNSRKHTKTPEEFIPGFIMKIIPAPSESAPIQ